MTEKVFAGQPIERMNARLPNEAISIFISIMSEGQVNVL